MGLPLFPHFDLEGQPQKPLPLLQPFKDPGSRRVRRAGLFHGVRANCSAASCSCGRAHCPVQPPSTAEARASGGAQLDLSSGAQAVGHRWEPVAEPGT